MRRKNFRRTLGYSIVATRGSEYIIPMLVLTSSAVAFQQLTKPKNNKRKRRLK